MKYLDLIKERRDFLKFLGRNSAAAIGASALLSAPTRANASPKKNYKKLSKSIAGIAPSSKDDVVLAKGLISEIFISYNETINPKGEKFGYNNDYIACIPINSKRAWMWVNHEFSHPIFVGRWDKKKPRTKSQVTAEMKAEGGSLFQIEKKKGQWVVDKKHKKNIRLHGLSEIPFASARPIQGKKSAMGTLQNCAGGITPWGTFLTCEENYHMHYGDNTLNEKGQKVSSQKPRQYMEWNQYFNHPPEHYGWVVEINPDKGKAKKLTSLGRFSHESATTVLAKDKRCVVYSGDDKTDQCLYKFISDKPNSLETGTLYVANLKAGKWVPLVHSDPRLKKYFSDQTQILEYTRKAAELVGGTPLHRPEDIEIDPKTKAVYLTLTNHAKKADFHGSILKIEEKGSDFLSLDFTSSVFLTGGDKTKFSCPDNLAFDHKGNLWMCSDIHEKFMGSFPYASFKNNGLFYIPMSGPQAGQAIQLASAPTDAEFTGLSFSPDNKTLFLSVQHPGNSTKTLGEWKSHWPDGGQSEPRPAVIQISGPLFDELLG